MRKLQQFFVAKFPSGRLEKDNFNINRNISELRLKKELVSLADSQVLRTIRYIRYKNNNEGLKYSAELLKDLQSEKKRILKSKNKEEKQKISKIIKDINEILYIPEYILITVENLSDYRKMIRTGLIINGKKYVRLLCGAGMARNNTVAFVLEDIEIELKTMLKNGMDENILITENKYNAYFALSSTATHTVSTPRFLLVPDCEIKMTKPVDFVTETFADNPLHNKEKIESVFAELDFNLFDGGGLISIEKATEWAKELELDYVPSVFIIRNIFVKGCLFTIDFKKFAKEVAKKDKVIDLYGDEIDINETDIILTKSQHKLYNAYTSVKQYQDFCDLNLNFWGISRVSPKNDDNFFLTNYQFCQVLDLKDEDVKELCTPTVDWLTKVSGLDRNYSLLFLLGNLCDKTDIDPKDLFNITSDNLTKALIANKEMINDEYIRQTLVYSINKKIQESYIGKLIVKGCFNTMIPDLYALMEHAFGLEVKGLLKEFEHYAQYWNNRGAKSAVGMRSPLTWRSEVNKLNFIQNEQTEEWFQYINSGVIYNVWGSDCMIAADGDFDGDIQATTDNPVFLRCRYDNLPITYSKSNVKKKKIKESNLYKADLDSFNTDIGGITNYSTSFYDVLNKYYDLLNQEPNNDYYKKCYDEIIERLKITRKQQGNAIDRAKGIKADKYPSTWINRQKITPDDSLETIEQKNFLNDVCGDKKPYFFKYRYMNSNHKYNEYKISRENYCYSTFKKHLKEILTTPLEKLSTEEQEFVNIYYKYVPLIDYNSPMNKICHYMEDHLKKLKEIKNLKTPMEVIDLMRTQVITNEEKIDKIKELCKMYFEKRTELKKSQKIQDNKTLTNEDFSTIEQYAKHLREVAFEFFGDAEDIANTVVETCYVRNYRQSKSFAWNVFGKYIVQNIVRNSNSVTTVPVKSEFGEIDYLYNKYKEVEVDLSDNI